MRETKSWAINKTSLMGWRMKQTERNEVEGTEAEKTKEEAQRLWLKGYWLKENAEAKGR